MKFISIKLNRFRVAFFDFIMERVKEAARQLYAELSRVKEIEEAIRAIEEDVDVRHAHLRHTLIMLLTATHVPPWKWDDYLTTITEFTVNLESDVTVGYTWHYKGQHMRYELHERIVLSICVSVREDHKTTLIRFDPNNFHDQYCSDACRLALVLRAFYHQYQTPFVILPVGDLCPELFESMAPIKWPMEYTSETLPYLASGHGHEPAAGEAPCGAGADSVAGVVPGSGCQ